MANEATSGGSSGTSTNNTSGQSASWLSNWTWMKAQDAISGKEGTLIAKWKNSSGQYEQHAIAECKSIVAKVTKNKSEFKALGQPATQYKANGWTGTGTLVVYYYSSEYAWIMSNYANDHLDMYFSVQIVNEDPTSNAGRQEIVLTDVNLDEAEIAKLDVDAEFLDQTMNFTFSGFTINSSFGD